MNEKKQLVLIVLSLIVLMVVVNVGYNYLSKDYSMEKQPAEQAEKKVAADFYVYNQEGEPVYLSHYKGVKPVVVNFWASWCSPCQYEMPYFQKATDQYGEEVEILMVNLTDGLRETMENANEFVERNDYQMNILYDLDYSAVRTYQVQGVPRTLFIDIDGNIVRDHMGLIEEEDLLNTIDKLLQ